MTIQELYDFGKELGVLNYDIVIRETKDSYDDIIRPVYNPVITSSKSYKCSDSLTEYIVSI